MIVNNKKMIRINIIVIFSFLSIITDAQNQNEIEFTNLSTSLFDEIKFHGVLFTDIKDANANVDVMEELFENEEEESTVAQNGMQIADGYQLSINQYGEDIGEPRKDFVYYFGLKVYFGITNNSDTYEVLDLKANSISINEVTLEIEDDIENLNIDYHINSDIENDKFIFIIRNGSFCCPISISLTPDNKVSKIHYYKIP